LFSSVESIIRCKSYLPARSQVGNRSII